ncbi:3-mercaptopyruvate sulfurtransferase [Paracoccus albus]|uniref:3-mercaptopyruvate sulfurtransferase n=1 Tax=Paracoccus albus TaxID=3017784 RepID=UPI0022F01425|nr:3-mercaptopyruvate sulfurtransferase [Paracoccus albus]WBU58892.1 3-mercaptopyruvate sulfurtransferase [Paracoccus albus]
MTDDPKTLVSTDWLAARLGDADIRILDASWHMPAAGRDAQAEFDERHIPGAQFFDIDAISDPDSDLPHMAPSPAVFAGKVGQMGIGPGQQVVIYDHAATRSAARAWWTFRLMGFSNVAVLDGGLGKWLAENRPVTADVTGLLGEDVQASRDAALVRNREEVASASQLGTHEIVDARAAPRFRGEAPEPREGLRSGHMPGAKNLPFDRLYNEDGTMKSGDALRAQFDDASVDLSRPVITTCGSGITAASLSLALERLGHRNHALYDGSWTEWGAHPDSKIATGDA